MIRQYAWLAVLLVACTSPAVAPTASPIEAPTFSITPTPQATVSRSAIPSAAVSPGTRAFAGAGLETFVAGRLAGEIAFVIRPVQPKGDPNAATEYRELWAVPLDGRQATLAIRFRTPKTSSVVDANVLGRQLSPDGKRIVLSVGIGEIEVASQLEVIELETGRVTPLFPGSGLASDDTYPAWSPDGSLIAFVRWPHRGAVDLGALWVVGADGKGARQLRAAPGRGAFVRILDWLPDSRRLAFDPLNFESSAFAVIDIGGVEGARGERLSSDLSGALPVAFRSQRPSLALTTVDSPYTPMSFDLVVADDVGSTARTVATVKPDAATGELGLVAPRWDPGGGNQILYRITGSGSTTVHLNIDTGASIRIGSRVKSSEWSQDGKKIVTIEEHPSTANDAVYVWGRDGTLITERIGLPGSDPLVYRLTDLAVRGY